MLVLGGGPAAGMWCVRLSDSQRDAMRALVSTAVERDPGLAPLLEAIDLARWDDLPEASLPWDRVSELAREQSIGEADVVWDLASGMKPHRRLQLPVRAQLPAPRSPDVPQS